MGAFDEPPWDDQPEPPGREDVSDLTERIEALEAKCALLAASLKHSDAAFSVAAALVRRADELIGPLTRPDEIAPWERDARAFLDALDGKPPF